MILYPEMYIIVGYVQIFWHRLLGKQHNIECYKAKGMTIKIYFQKNSLCNICYISLSGSQLSFVLKEEIWGLCSYFFYPLYVAICKL